MKQRIVQLRQEGLTLREIADHLKVSVGAAHKTLNIHEEYGEYTDPSKKRTGRPQILDDDDECYLKSLLESNPSIYLDEIKQKFEGVCGVSVSMATISRFLRSRDFTWKALARPALEANEKVRTCYQVETSRFTDPDYFVFVDESHVDEKTARRSKGWSLIGVPPVERSTFLRGVRHSILPALTTEGIVALEIFEGSVNKERFIQFLHDDVVCTFHCVRFWSLNAT
jgi:transposase